MSKVSELNQQKKGKIVEVVACFQLAKKQVGEQLKGNKFLFIRCKAREVLRRILKIELKPKTKLIVAFFPEPERNTEQFFSNNRS